MRQWKWYRVMRAVALVAVVVLFIGVLVLVFKPNSSKESEDKTPRTASSQSTTTLRKPMNSLPLAPGFKAIEFENLAMQVPADWPVRTLTYENECEMYNTTAVYLDFRAPEDPRPDCGDDPSMDMNMLYIGRATGAEHPESPTTIVNGEIGRVVTNEEDRLGIVLPDLQLFIYFTHPVGDRSVVDPIVQSIVRSDGGSGTEFGQ